MVSHAEEENGSDWDRTAEGSSGGSGNVIFFDWDDCTNMLILWFFKLMICVLYGMYLIL